MRKIKTILLFLFIGFVLTGIVAFTVTRDSRQITQSRASENDSDSTGNLLSASAEPGVFQETFDGAPSAPQAYSTYPGSSSWDTLINFRDYHDTERVTNPFPPVNAHHGSNCEKPVDSQGNLVTHPITTGVQNHVFICNNHLMTSINGGEYGAIYLKPNRLVDFSNGEAVIRFDMSTFRTAGRDWVDFWITPYEDHIIAPLERWRPDFNGEPRRGVQIVMGDTGSATPFRTIFQGRKIVNYGYPNTIAIESKGYLEDYVKLDAARRDTFEIRISKSRLKFSLFINRGSPIAQNAVPDAVFIDSPIPGGLDWNQGVFQIGHHSYNPTKDCGEPNHAGFNPCGPNTWHWDNISIQPSREYTIVKSDIVSRSILTAQRVNFPAPAPEQASLMFYAFDASQSEIELSFNDGASWVPAVRAPGANDVDPNNTSIVRNTNNRGQYKTPVPAGVRSVLIRGKQDANWGAWVHSPTIISLAVSGAGGPTAVPLPSATPPPTGVPPTGVPPTPTSAPPTPTPQLSPTPLPTRLPTPTPPAGERLSVTKTITQQKSNVVRTVVRLVSTENMKVLVRTRIIDFNTGAVLKQTGYQERTLETGKPVAITVDTTTTVPASQVNAVVDVYVFEKAY